MKSRKLFTFLFTVLVLFVFAAPSVVKAAPRTTNVTIHKMELFLEETELPVDHDGTELDGSELDALLGADNYKPLPGVEFSYWEVDSTFELGDSVAGAPLGSATTNASGIIEIENLPDGYYYFEETFTPVNVVKQIASPFILGLPVMNAEGTAYIEDLHIYPKNVTVRGAVVLQKFADDEGLEGVGFRLYEGTYPDGTEYDPEGSVEAMEYFTDENGEIIINNLPVGLYYFIETTAVAPYLINTDPLAFEIDANGEVIIDEDELRVDEVGDVQFVSLDNFEEPEITKLIEGGTEFDANYNEEIEFTLDIELPADINNYDALSVTDTINSKLDYLNDLKVEGSTDGLTFLPLTAPEQFSAVEPAVGSSGDLVVTFVPAMLMNGQQVTLTHIRITFTAAINETAIMGQGIPNMATVDYDNGSTTGDDESEEVNAFTGGRRFIKVNGSDETLEGAEFIIVNNEDMEMYLTLIDGEYGWAPLDLNADVTALPNAVELVSGAEGIFEIKGLAYGTYYLYETVAPMSDEGYPYNLIDDPIEFTITAGSYYLDPEATTLVEIDPSEVLNVLGPQIPQTGGIGTVLFTLIGGGLMGSAVILNKKRSRS